MHTIPLESPELSAAGKIAGMSRKGPRKPGARASSALQILEGRARSLERWLFVLVAIVSLAPPSVYFVTELMHAGTRAMHDAGEIVALAAEQSDNGHRDLASVEETLRAEMARETDIAVVRILGGGDRELLRLEDDLASSGLLTSARLPLPAAMAPMLEVEVQVRDAGLLRAAGRVLAVHLVVGLILAIGIYLVPVRALKQAVAQLAATQEQLVHADKLGAVGEVYAGFTHEINNPLGVILARVALMRAALEEHSTGGDLHRDLEVIERHGNRIAETVKGLLTFARKAEFEREPTDLNQIVGSVVALVEKPFAKQGVHVKTDLAPSLPPLVANSDHLQQVFLNLLNNARDAMPQGGTISLRTSARRDRLVAEVQDSGTGFAFEDRDRLFEPFFTTKGVGKGTGLGLSISHGIIHAHGGDIEAEGEPDKGALFRVTLPVGKAEV